MTSSTLRGRQIQIRRTNPALVAQAAVGAVTAGALWFTAGQLAPPDTVETTVVNETDYDLDVAVTGGGTGVQPFGRVEHDATRVQPRFVDPGDPWLVVFSYGSDELGRLSLTAADLDRADHVIEVPPEVVSRARELGLEPPPP